MVETYEKVVNHLPFRVARRVRWSDCDPAGVVYTGKFMDYLLGAVSLFYASLAGGDYHGFLRQAGVTTPCRGLEMDFRGALWPEDEFTMTVRVAQLRRSTFDLRVHAVQDGGREIFLGRFTPICIPATERKRIPIPEPLRAALLPHLDETP